MKTGRRIRSDIGQELHTGTATVIDKDVEKEDGETVIYYRLVDVILDEDCEDKNIDMHRDEKHELWVNSFEIVLID